MLNIEQFINCSVIKFLYGMHESGKPAVLLNLFREQNTRHKVL